MVRSRGFTLIELLVVIAIIGLLASIILASLNTAQQKGRDARRISDMKEIQLALELYYDAHNAYPTGTAAAGTTASASTLPGSDLVSNYITQLPADPSQPSSGSSAYYYQYESLNPSDDSQCTSSSGAPCQAYVLVAHLEAGANSATWSSTSVAACPSNGGSTAPYAYCVHS